MALPDPRAVPATVRVAIDATPLLGPRTGIGRYVEALIAALAAGPAGPGGDLALRAAAFSLRGRSGLADLPSGVPAVRRPVPAPLLHRAWLRGALPPAEWLLGAVDVVHGTNFVLPPPHRAAGVVTVHDLTFRRYPELVDAASLAYRTLVPAALRRAALVLTPSAAVAGELAADFGLDPARVRVTPLGIDPVWFAAGDAPRPVADAPLPRDYLLSVATLEPRKGLDVLLDAYRLLYAQRPASAVPPLVLVGGAGWGPALDLRGLPAGRVITTGYLPAERLPPLVARARALAFPSRYEGFGLPPLEALAAGTPVIASDLPVTREVLGEHAAFVPVGDAAALAAALAGALDDPPDAVRREAGRAHAATFTWQRCAELTARAYRDAAR